MKLRFLFRSLYVSKENEYFGKFTTFLDGSDLCLSAFVSVSYSLKMFALFLERNSVPLTDQCWFDYGLLRRRPPGCLSVCFACISQMLDFWIDDVGVSLIGICIRFLEVCLNYCRCLLIYWLGFIF